MRINLAQFEPYSLANGPGVRAVIWTQGCSIRCPGCINSGFLGPGGNLVEIADLFNHIAGLKIDGVTFSGGEPFEQAKALTELAKKCRAMGLSVISYSGYTLSELKRDRAPHLGSRSLLNQLDVLIDGPFRLKLAGDLPYRGSSNQLIHLLTDRYSLDDFVSVRVEIRIDEKGIQVTGFLNPDKERSF